MSALIYNNTQIGYEMSSTYGKLFLNSDVCLGYGISKQALNDNLRRNQDELIEYKKECFNVLNNYFNNGIAINHRTSQTYNIDDIFKLIEKGLK